MESVAIIGAGPSGLTAARYLASEGFEPTLFEQASRIGGQWSGDPAVSAVWPSLRTNTSRVLTAFSDLRHPPDTPVYPDSLQVRRYLDAYAALHDLEERARFGTRVERLTRANSGGWTVHSVSPAGSAAQETFDRVVVAAGRYHRPCHPTVPGAASFKGRGGISHSQDYKDPDRYRGLRVLVGGCAISALEIASDLAMLGAERVVTSQRRQRYVLQKLCAGVPVDHLAFNRFAAMAARVFPPEHGAAALKGFVLRCFGSPAQLGAPAPADALFAAGLTLCQHFMPLVAEGRIGIKPWISRIDGDTVTFDDGSAERFDAIVFATGYHLDLPFLDDDLRRALEVDDQYLTLHNLTFHPDLPGLAFSGLFHQVGPYFPVVELQARYIAYTWSGTRPSATDAVMRAGLVASRQQRGPGPGIPMHMSASLFAGGAGVEPDLSQWPEMARALMFGPLAPISYRMSGRDRLPEAPSQLVEDARAFGAVPSATLSPEQCAQLQALAAATRDSDFAQYVGRVTTL